jgi:undecaprenyl-diphosphatase
MDQLIQALVLGVVQGLTEFLPISSSGHLIIVPYLVGWNDPFITSLGFTVALHAGTLLALLLYFRDDWLRLIPAGIAVIRDRSFRGDPDRRLAWLLVISTIPAAILGVLLNDPIENAIRQAGVVAVLLVVAAAILWLADRWGSGLRSIERLSVPSALGIGFAQALALFPGVSRSGISIAAGMFAGLDRPDAARYSFLMATPVTAGAVLYEGLKLVKGGELTTEAGPLVVGVAAAFASGVLAISALLRYVRTRSYNVFVAYRLVLAAVVLAVFLTR